MNLSDALGGGPGCPGQNNQQGGGGVWPGGQPNQPTWPGQPGVQPAWPGQQQPGQPTPMWPGQQPNPSQPSWPGQQYGGGVQPSQPTCPGQPGGGPPSQTTWPGQPSQPTAPQHHSLKVPYVQSLPNGCYDEMVITINGTINHNAKMFTLNLTKGNDIAMHINPRFDDHGKKIIVRNSLIGNKWGKEERGHNHFPFTQGQPFEMKIMCTSNEFRVAVNSSHLLEFKHRICDLDSIKNLGIYNDVTLTSVEINDFI